MKKTFTLPNTPRHESGVRETHLHISDGEGQQVRIIKFNETRGEMEIEWLDSGNDLTGSLFTRRG